MIWLDVVLLILLMGIGNVLACGGLAHLLDQDRAEAKNNRESACRPHGWERTSAGLVCKRCGRVPSESS